MGLDPWPLWLSWVEHPVDGKVVGWTPSSGTYLGCGFDPWVRAHRREQLVNVSLSNPCLSLSLSLYTPLPLSKSNEKNVLR